MVAIALAVLVLIAKKEYHGEKQMLNICLSQRVIPASNGTAVLKQSVVSSFFQKRMSCIQRHMHC